VASVTRGSPQNFRPTSVQFKGRINNGKARKRHQTRHLEFYASLLTAECSTVELPGSSRATTILS